jgi:quercetin dioxygenase-like cupin family protein
MRRVHVVLSIVAVMMLGILALGTQPRALAQDATPAVDDMMQEGVAFVPIGFAEGATLPSPSDLIAVRVTIDPGAVSPFLEDDPTSGLLIVESGTFTMRIEAPWAVSRGATVKQLMEAPSGEEPEVMEAIASGDETTLVAGDTALIPGSVNGEIRNDGQEPAVGLVVLFTPGGTMAGAAP